MDLSDLARHGASEVVFECYPERGWNLRMTDLQAALGLTQLALLDGSSPSCRAIADSLHGRPHGLAPHLEPPLDPPYAVRTWQSYPVRIRPRSPIGRAELMQLLLDDGIATRRGVMAIHHEPPYSDARLLPHTDAAAPDILMLPLFRAVAEAEQDHVVSRWRRHGGAGRLAPTWPVVQVWWAVRSFGTSSPSAVMRTVLDSPFAP